MAISYGVFSLGIKHPAIGDVEVSGFVYLATILAMHGLAFSIAGPAMNNVAIELAPDKMAAITGMRTMFRVLGGTFGVSIAILVASRAGSTAQGLELAFGGLAVLCLLTTLLVRGVPNTVGGGIPQRRRSKGAGPRDATEPAVPASAGDTVR